MTEKTNELGRFALGLRVIKLLDGKLLYQMQTKNQNIPVEVIIMQLKAFLNKLENDYFDKFNQSFSKV